MSGFVNLASLRSLKQVIFHTASNGQSSFHRHAGPYLGLDWKSIGGTVYLLANYKTTLLVAENLRIGLKTCDKMRTPAKRRGISPPHFVIFASF